MSSPNPLENLVSQLASLLKSIQNQKLGSGELSPEIYKKLEQAEKDVDLFCKINQDLLNKAGVTQQELQHIDTTKETLPLKQQRLLKNLGELKKDANEMHLKIVLAQMSGKAATDKDKASKKRKQNKRKDKFKRLGGGDKGWLPL